MRNHNYTKIASFLLGKNVKKWIRIIWFLLMFIGVLSYFIYPEYFTQESIQVFLKNQEAHLLLFYSLISIIRGVFLIPSTPFVLAGAILFPENLILVFGISMFGIIGSGVLLYVASNFLEIGKIFKKINKKKVKWLEQKMKKHGFWITLIWSFTPIVPTDLIAYIAGATKFNIKKFIIALFLGESIIVIFYLFLGQFLNDLFI